MPAKREADDPKWLQNKTLEKITDVENFSLLINATNKLSDEDFEDHVNDVGFRLALLHMRRGAMLGNLKLVQACKLYLERCDASKARRKPPDKERDVTPVQFLPASRE